MRTIAQLGAAFCVAAARSEEQRRAGAGRQKEKLVQGRRLGPGDT